MTVISIIGGTGKMGYLFVKALKEKGYNVIVSGRNTEISSIDAAKKGDIIIVSVPIKVTNEVIKKISPYIKKQAILSDFTSIKTTPCKTMLKYSKSEVIGGHPVFGPTVNLKNQPFVICPVRASKSSIKTFSDILTSIGLNVIQMTPAEHDKAMAVIQCMNHFSNLSFAKALENLKFNLKKRELFSPAFTLKMNVIERMLSQDPSLYAEIETSNPYAKEYAKKYLRALLEIKKCIDSRDEKALENKIKSIQTFFKKGEKEPTESLEKINILPEKISHPENEIAVLGPVYSYCDILAKRLFPKSKFVLCNNIEEIFKVVSENKAHLGLSPIENMLNGSVREAIFSLKKYNVKINKLFNMPIHHCLASKSNQFKKIISHQQALAQCSLFLQDYINKGYEIIEASSTSKAMELASKEEVYAAIGSVESAGHYNLNIIKENIEDNHHNVTSFILISLAENKHSLNGKVRTSMLISPEKDKPGLLYEILSIFKKNDINLTKIESIPTGNKIGEYLFYLEFDGDSNDENVRLAIDLIKSLHNIYSLGSYEIETL